jgi:hypothetical protein
MLKVILHYMSTFIIAVAMWLTTIEFTRYWMTYFTLYCIYFYLKPWGILAINRRCCHLLFFKCCIIFSMFDSFILFSGIRSAPSKGKYSAVIIKSFFYQSAYVTENTNLVAAVLFVANRLSVAACYSKLFYKFYLSRFA